MLVNDKMKFKTETFLPMKVGCAVGESDECTVGITKTAKREGICNQREDKRRKGSGNDKCRLIVTDLTYTEDGTV